MRYAGGKIRQSKAVTATLLNITNKYNVSRKTYTEPFMGALGSAEKAIPALAAVGFEHFWLSDKNRLLVEMWVSILDGTFVPPDFVSEEQYAFFKANRDSIEAIYSGFAHAFGGNFFKTYARDGDGLEPRRSQLNQKTASIRKIEAIKPYNPSFFTLPYNLLSIPSNSLVYLDPPYTNSFGEFNHDAFWEWTRDLSKRSFVIISEFKAPEDFKSIYNWGDTVVRHNEKRRENYVKPIKNEQLFVYSKGLLRDY